MFVGHGGGPERGHFCEKLQSFQFRGKINRLDFKGTSNGRRPTGIIDFEKMDEWILRGGVKFLHLINGSK